MPVLDLLIRPWVSGSPFAFGVVDIRFVHIFFFVLCVLFVVEWSFGARIKLIILSALSVIAGVVIFSAAVDLIAVLSFHAPYSLILRQVLYAPAAMKAAEHYSQLDEHLSGSKIGAFLLGVILSGSTAISYGYSKVSRVELTLSQRRRFAVALAFLLTFAGLLAHEILFQGVFLQFSAYSVLLWPFLALAIFAIEFDWDTIPVTVALLFSVLCFAGLSSRTFSADEYTETIGSVAVALVAGGLAIAFLTLTHGVARWAIGCAFVVALSGSAFVWRSEEQTQILWEPPLQGESYASQYQRRHFGLYFLSDVLDANPALRFPKFWTNEFEVPDGSIYAQSYFACKFQSFFPKYDQEIASIGQNFSSGDTVVVVARGPNLLQRMSDAFDKINLIPKIIGSMTMEDPRGSYEIVVSTVAGKADGVTR